MVKNIVCIVQARMNSKRLPGKVLMKLNKRFNVLEFLIIRLKKSKEISKIIVACTKNKKDEKIIRYLKKMKIDFFRGSEPNVLQRYYEAAKKFKADVIIRITSDCPFSDPKLIDKFLKIFKKSNYDYYGNTKPRTFPDGLDIEIFNFKTLKKAKKMCKSKFDLEHVTPYMLRSNSLRRGNFNLSKDLSKLRITLDTKMDLRFIRKIAIRLNPKKYFSWKKILLNLEKV